MGREMTGSSDPHRGNSRARVVIRELAEAIGENGLSDQPEELDELTANTLGIRRDLIAVVRPVSTEQVRAVVGVCAAHRVGVYPVSRGQNVGYGERAPVVDRQILMDLSEMNRIRDVDFVHGKATVEPGVTQEQLYAHLAERNAGFGMDATGSSALSSVVGNTLEGGFGHTPVGDRRQLVSSLEVVLGNGEVLRAGSFPDVGPDLNVLFVQSNFGIVTAMEVTLFPLPERYESFLIRVASEDGLEPLIDALASLRRDGTLTSLVHVANATRTLVSGVRLPDAFQGRRFTNSDAVKFLTTPIVRAGYWTGIGGIYGSRKMVAARRGDLRRAVRGLASVQFITDRKLGWLEWATRNRWFRRLPIAEKAQLALEAASYVHGLGRGVPSDQGMEGEMRRTAGFAEPGLFWCSPTFAAEGGLARAVVDIGERLFENHEFELPVTITFVTPGRVIATMSCSFDAADGEQLERAHHLFYELHAELARNGISTYREGILGMDGIRYTHVGKDTTFSKLKRALDPDAVVSPGRYGIG